MYRVDDHLHLIKWDLRQETDRDVPASRAAADGDTTPRSFNTKDEIYSSSQLMFNLVSGAFLGGGNADGRCLMSDRTPLILAAVVTVMSLQD